MKPTMKISEVLQWLIFVTVIVACVGCTQIIYTDPNGVTVKYNDWFKDIDFDELKIKELLEIRRYTGESPDVEVYTAGGIVKISDGNSN